jgi:hypothetical protein
MPIQTAKPRNLTRAVAIQHVVRSVALLLVLCAGQACGQVRCPPGTMLDGQFCRRIGRTAGAGDPTASGSLADPVILGCPSASLTAAGSGASAGSPAPSCPLTR